MDRSSRSPLVTSLGSAPVEALIHQLTAAEAEDFGAQMPAALRAIHEAGRASAQVLQTELGVSYCRAARILDAMERLGLIPPQVRPPQRASLFTAAPRVVKAA